MEGFGNLGHALDVAFVAAGESGREGQVGNGLLIGVKAFLVGIFGDGNPFWPATDTESEGFLLPFAGAGPGDAFAEAAGVGSCYDAGFVAIFSCLGFGGPVTAGTGDTCSIFFGSLRRDFGKFFSDRGCGFNGDSQGNLRCEY